MPEQVIDLMAALKASLAEKQKERAEAPAVTMEPQPKELPPDAEAHVHVEAIDVETGYHNALIDAGWDAFHEAIRDNEFETSFRGVARGMIDEATKRLKARIEELEQTSSSE